ncbi:DUF4192 domain-containing protein [Nonomuraea sp. NPDC049784]|uniref:DUF4192 domain-containing protein n=1 Tax=Nonomuraea sp. NPDC049784 TaxID=3154361 RepID=UPI0033D0500E
MSLDGCFEPLVPIDPAELLGLVPFLLGHQPRHALLVLAFSGQEQPQGVIQQTLPASGTADTVALAQHTLQVLGRMPEIRQVVLIGYGADEQVTPTMDVVRFLLDGTGIRISEALRFQDNRYWSYLCSREPDCCRADGEPVDPASSATAAYAAMLGLASPKDSVAFAHQLDPVTGLRRRQMDQAARHAWNLVRRRQASIHPYVIDAMDSIQRALDMTAAGQALSDEQVAWLGVLASSKLVRDTAATLLTTWAVTDHLRLWSGVTRLVPSQDAFGPALLTAYFALRAGDGPLAQVALDRAQQIKPGDRNIEVLRLAAQMGLSPRQFARMQDRQRQLLARATDTFPRLGPSPDQPC